MLDIAKEKGITDYEQRVAYHVPVIAVPEGNPTGITSLADLAKPGVTIIRGDSKAAAIGKLGISYLRRTGYMMLWRTLPSPAAQP